MEYTIRVVQLEEGVAPSIGKPYGVFEVGSYIAELDIGGTIFYHVNKQSPWEAVRMLLLDIQNQHTELSRVDSAFLNDEGIERKEATQEFLEGE